MLEYESQLEQTENNSALRLSDPPRRRKGLPVRALRGLAILERGGQILKVNDKSFLVKSQSTNRDYGVTWLDGKWYCECEDFKERNKDCKHIFAVNYLLRLPDIVLANSSAIQVIKCQKCGSPRLGKRGYAKNKSGSVPMLYCKDCGKRVQDNILRSSGGANSGLALIALDLHFKGVSVRNISNHFYQVWGIIKPPSTIEYWLAKFTKLVVMASNELKLTVSDKWLADEFFVKERGVLKYIWNVLDFETRKLIASVMLSGRGTKEAVQALTTAIENAGQVPKEIVTDGLPSYKNAIQTMDLKVKHTANVGIRDKNNNNRIERMHNTMRAADNAKRGVKDGHLFAEGFRAYYNNIMPHLGDFGKDGSMKWVDLIAHLNDEK